MMYRDEEDRIDEDEDEDEACKYCLKVDCECSDFDICGDFGARG